MPVGSPYKAVEMICKMHGKTIGRVAPRTDRNPETCCRQCDAATKKRWAKTPKAKAIQKKSFQKFRDAIRAETLAAYGGMCVCCGETIPAFLTIDHIFGDGKKDRKPKYAGGWGHGAAQQYIWLKKNGFPKDRFRLLCMNCNFATRFGRVCPHANGDTVRGLASVQ